MMVVMAPFLLIFLFKTFFGIYYCSQLFVELFVIILFVGLNHLFSRKES